MNELAGTEATGLIFDEIEDPETKRKIALIRTSDRIAFKRCRRKWNWSSGLRGNLEPDTSPGPLWMGSGFHYAMEDFHGNNIYGSPKKAFLAYDKAWQRLGANRLPMDHPELRDLCVNMLEYYSDWLISRDPLKTFIYEGKPQVEVSFEVPLPIDLPADSPYDAVHYGGTIDRVAIDEDNRLWPIDYKTAKTFGTLHYETDPQITAYMWVIKALYPGYEIGGFIYQQHLKAEAKGPQILKNGSVSVNKMQVTTHRLYKKALLEIYGDVAKSPGANIEFLNALAMQEDSESDRFIRRDRVERSQRQIEAEGEKILMEACDMLDHNLPLYPNPTRDCSWDCPFQGACILMDCGDEYQSDLNNNFIQRSNETAWRKYLPKPEELGE